MQPGKMPESMKASAGEPEFVKHPGYEKEDENRCHWRCWLSWLAFV
jgi:hypothetical protein